MPDSEKDRSKPRKPLLFAENPFDDGRTPAAGTLESEWDGSYVPGYSEAKRENDIRKAKGQEPVPIPKLYWARVTGSDGEYVNQTDEGMFQTLRLGFKAMGVEDLERYGYGLPPMAKVTEDGLISRGDLALFYVSPERAEQNREKQKRIKQNSKALQAPEDRKNELYAERPSEDNTDRRGTLEEIAEMEPTL